MAKKKKEANDTVSSISSSSSSSNSSDDEPLIHTRKKSSEKVNTPSSGNESPEVLHKKDTLIKDEAKSDPVKSNIDSSEDEPLKTVSNINADGEKTVAATEQMENEDESSKDRKLKSDVDSNVDTSDTSLKSSDNENQEPSKVNTGAKRKRTVNSNDNKAKKKRKTIGKDETEASHKLSNLLRYLRACSVRISNYSKFFEGCKTMKSKEEKVSQMLQEMGVTGRPTLEKCKKVRQRREEKMEIAELDRNNIIEGARRSSRSSALLTQPLTVTISKTSTKKHMFGNLADLVESECSGPDSENSADEKAPKKKLKVILSDSD